MGDRAKRRASQINKYTDHNSDDDSLEEFLNERVPYNRPTPVVLEKISDAQVDVMNAAECISILRARQVIGMKETPKWSLQTMRYRVKQEIKKAQRGEGTTIQLEDDDEEVADGDDEDGEEDEEEEQNEDEDEEEEAAEVIPRAKRRRSSDQVSANEEDQDIDILSPASSNQPPSATTAPSSDVPPAPPTGTAATPVSPTPKKAPARKPKTVATPVPFSSPGSGFEGPITSKVKAGISCGHCRLKHRGCDGNRPCRNCINIGAPEGCADPPPWMRSDRRHRKAAATGPFHDGAVQASTGNCVSCAKKANSECSYQRCRSCCQAEDLDCLVHSVRLEDGTPRVKPVPLIQGLSRSGLPLPFVHSLQLVEDPLALVHPAESIPCIARAAPVPPISQLTTQCPYCGDLVSNIGVDLYQHMSRCDPTAFHEYLAGRVSVSSASPSLAVAASTSHNSHTATTEPLQLAQANAEKRIAKQLALARDIFGISPTVEEAFKLLQYEAIQDGDRLSALQKRLAALESVVQRHTQRTAQQYNILAEKQRVRSEAFWKLYETLCKASTTQELAQVQAAYETEMQVKTSATSSSSTLSCEPPKAIKVTRAQQDSVRKSLKAENSTAVLVKL